jgi:hypothetical protein
MCIAGWHGLPAAGGRTAPRTLWSKRRHAASPAEELPISQPVGEVRIRTLPDYPNIFLTPSIPTLRCVWSGVCRWKGVAMNNQRMCERGLRLASSPHRGRAWRQLFPALVGSLVLAATACADRPGFDALDCVIDRPVFAEVCERLALDDDQVVIAGTLFDEYFTAVRALEEKTARRHKEVGREFREFYDERFRERRRQTKSGLVDMQFTAEELAWEQEVLLEQRRIWREGLGTADGLLAQFYVDLEAILTDAQLEQMEGIQRLVRRRSELGSTAENRRWADYGSPLDLTVLVETASREPEMRALAVLRGDEPMNSNDAPDNLDELCAEFRIVMQLYVAETDAMIQERLAARRRPRVYIDPRPSTKTKEGRRWFDRRGRAAVRRMTLIRDTGYRVESAL